MICVLVLLYTPFFVASAGFCPRDWCLEPADRGSARGDLCRACSAIGNLLHGVAGSKAESKMSRGPWRCPINCAANGEGLPFCGTIADPDVPCNVATQRHRDHSKPFNPPSAATWDIQKQAEFEDQGRISIRQQGLSRKQKVRRQGPRTRQNGGDDVSAVARKKAADRTGGGRNTELQSIVHNGAVKIRRNEEAKAELPSSESSMLSPPEILSKLNILRAAKASAVLAEKYDKAAIIKDEMNALHGQYRNFNRTTQTHYNDTHLSRGSSTEQQRRRQLSFLQQHSVWPSFPLKDSRMNRGGGAGNDHATSFKTIARAPSLKRASVQTTTTRRNRDGDEMLPRDYQKSRSEYSQWGEYGSSDQTSRFSEIIPQDRGEQLNYEITGQPPPAFRAAAAASSSLFSSPTTIANAQKKMSRQSLPSPPRPPPQRRYNNNHQNPLSCSESAVLLDHNEEEEAAAAALNSAVSVCVEATGEAAKGSHPLTDPRRFPTTMEGTGETAANVLRPHSHAAAAAAAAKTKFGTIASVADMSDTKPRPSTGTGDSGGNRNKAKQTLNPGKREHRSAAYVSTNPDLPLENRRRGLLGSPSAKSGRAVGDSRHGLENELLGFNEAPEPVREKTKPKPPPSLSPWINGFDSKSPSLSSASTNQEKSKSGSSWSLRWDGSGENKQQQTHTQQERQQKQHRVKVAQQQRPPISEPLTTFDDDFDRRGSSAPAGVGSPYSTSSSPPPRALNRSSLHIAVCVSGRPKTIMLPRYREHFAAVFLVPLRNALLVSRGSFDVFVHLDATQVHSHLCLLLVTLPPL